jgi:hypothetical protein
VLAALAILPACDSAMNDMETSEYQAKSNGTTLAGDKTLDICQVSTGVWRYSGVIAAWNGGKRSWTLR